VQQHDETARYGCESAPHYTGKKKDATPQFHVVALLGVPQNAIHVTNAKKSPRGAAIFL
jgi:hypothetical protein